MNLNKKKIASLLMALVMMIVISPLDDIAVAAVFGGAVFGFGSALFYLIMACSSAVSVAFWLRHKHVKHALSKAKLQLPQYWSLA